MTTGILKTDGEKLTRTFRIRKSSDFAILAKQAKIFRGNGFLVRYLNNRQNHARLGIAISKKQVKHAVKRNRIKRIVRETFRRDCLKLPNKDYMISYKDTPSLDNIATLQRKLTRFWQREVSNYYK